jgi:hypothetical protein
MGSTWESLLKELVDCRTRDYGTEAGRELARRENLEWIVQTMLEKLRDEEKTAPRLTRQEAALNENNGLCGSDRF